MSEQNTQGQDIIEYLVGKRDPNEIVYEELTAGEVVKNVLDGTNLGKELSVLSEYISPEKIFFKEEKNEKK